MDAGCTGLGDRIWINQETILCLVGSASNIADLSICYNNPDSLAAWTVSGDAYPTRGH